MNSNVVMEHALKMSLNAIVIMIVRMDLMSWNVVGVISEKYVILKSRLKKKLSYLLQVKIILSA